MPIVPRPSLTQVLIRQTGATLGRDDLTRLVRLYETILSNTDDFVYIFDPQGRFLYANARLLKVWAKTLDQIVGKTCHDLGYPEWHADLHMREIGQIVRDKVPVRNEVFFTGDSGISGFYDYIFKPVLDAAGEVEMIVGTTRDVTERKRGEEQLKAVQLELRQRAEELGETAGKFRALFDQAAVFAGIMTNDGVLIEANELCLLQCGYREEDVLGRPFWECGWWTRAPESADKLRRATLAAAGEGTPYRENLRYHYADGTERIVDFSLTPIRNQEGRVIYLNPAGVDITDAARAHAQADFLAHLTQALSLVSDEIEINRTATGLLGRFLGAQRAFCFQLLGDGQHVRILPDWHFAGDAGLAGDYPLTSLGTPALVEALRAGTVAVEDVRTDERTRPAAGNYLPLRILSFAFAPFSREGRWVASIGVVHDRPHRWGDGEKVLLENVAARVWPLIERARIEGDLHRANAQLGDRAAQLESIVQQRTHKLSETIGELEAFSYSISHDMRAPLRSMIGFSDLLLEEYAPRLDATGLDYLQRIGRAARRMDRLIQDVLGFSRLGGNEITLQPIKTELLLRDVIRSYPNFQSDRVAITIAAGLPPVLANEALLTQCISNLLENAVKFAAPGRKALVDVWAVTEGARTRLFFKDDGIGIPGHSLERIFDIFQRVGRDDEGTGIGLAIVRKAAEKMGGTVGVQSELGKGSVFWLDLASAPPTS